MTSWPSRGGRTPSVVDWFFRIYSDRKGALNLSYMQTGQENGFPWEEVSLGLPYQMEKIAKTSAKGGLIVETLAETGKRFMREHPENCPQTQIALDDWTGYGRKSIWYNSRFYRCNLLMEGDQLAIRDIHVMKDDFREPYYDTACEKKTVEYYTPPFIDKALDRDKTCRGDAAFDGEFASVEAVAADDRKTLVVTAHRKDGTTAVVTLREDGVEILGTRLVWTPKPSRRKEISVGPGLIGLRFQGYAYSVGVIGTVEETGEGYVIRPSGDGIAFSFGLSR